MLSRAATQFAARRLRALYGRLAAHLRPGLSGADKWEGPCISPPGGKARGPGKAEQMNPSCDPRAHSLSTPDAGSAYQGAVWLQSY